MSEKDICWTVKLDWLNILRLLRLVSINQIQELKREKAIKKITKTFGIEVLLDLQPEELDKLVVNELRELMHKELSMNARKKERMEKEMRRRFVPFKNGGIIKINPRDFKDLDLDAEPEDIIKQLAKKFLKDDDDDSEDDKNNYKEDSTGYYI
jgi:hypothetical protein